MCENSLSESSQGIRDAASRSRVGGEKIDEEIRELPRHLAHAGDSEIRRSLMSSSRTGGVKRRYGTRGARNRRQLRGHTSKHDRRGRRRRHGFPFRVHQAQRGKLYRQRRADGKGRMGTKEEDFVQRIYRLDPLYVLISHQGRVYVKAVSDPQAGRAPRESHRDLIQTRRRRVAASCRCATSWTANRS